MRKTVFLLIPLLLLYSCDKEMPDMETQDATAVAKSTRAWDNFVFDFGGTHMMGDAYSPEFYHPDEMDRLYAYVIGKMGGTPSYSLDRLNRKIYAGSDCMIFWEGYLGEEMHNMYLCIPGKWHFMAVAIDADERTYLVETYETDEVEAEVLFPDLAMIREALKYDMEYVWERTLNAADEDGRQEMGFWIYADIKGQSLEIVSGDVEEGDRVSGCGGISPSISPSMPELILPEESWDDARYPIAYFHTHTTLHYCDDGKRDTGFSNKDIEFSEQYDLPMLLYDYSDSPISHGGDLDAPAEIYETDLKQRPTPESWSDLKLDNF